MGAKIGRRVYWPGTGVFCPDPELLDIGDDVVFGSRSALITSGRIGSGKIIVGKGAIIADCVVLLPNTHVGSHAALGLWANEEQRMRTGHPGGGMLRIHVDDLLAAPSHCTCKKR